MQSGEIAYTYGKGSLLWAPRAFFDKTICNMYTKTRLINEGGVEIPLGDGMIRSRTKGYACKQCGYILIDCNQPGTP